MDRLRNRIQNYAWGSHSAIAVIEGRDAPTVSPEAELWMGAHPLACSELSRGGTWQPLDQVIERDPQREIGPATLARYGPRLPFLLKILAAEQPLSLQAHPTPEQARAGFAREEALSIPRDAGNRSYRDQNHKPELIVALGTFHALSGFRAVSASARLFAALGSPELEFVRSDLARGDGALGGLFQEILSLAGTRRSEVVKATLAACRRVADLGGEFALECGWALRLGELHPDDAGVLSALLLNLVVLEAGEAIYLPARNLHAYLSGVGVEIMASSDNVLRGGLTPKHVDVAELVRVLEFRSGGVEVLSARRLADESVYETPASEFRLSRLADGAERTPSGPEILLCTAGGFSLRSAAGTLDLASGQSAFVPVSEGAYSVSGQGSLFRASVGSDHG